MPTQKLTNEIITAAIEGFEAQKTRIDAQIAELRAILSGGPTETAATPETAPKKRKISAAARRRMALGQQARWAKIKGGTAPAPAATPEPAKPERKLSAATKAILVPNLKKARAAKAAKAKGAKKAPPVSKKAVVKKVAVKAPTAMAAKKKLSPARKAALVANLAKARAARAAKRAAQA